MKDLIPEWIADYKGFQQMPLELSAEIDQLEELRGQSQELDLVRDFLTDRHNLLQDEIDKWEVAAASGSKVLLMSEEERAGWDARIEAERLERAAKNVKNQR